MASPAIALHAIALPAIASPDIALPETAAMKALLSEGEHFLGGSERQVLYGLLLKYLIHLNFALFVFLSRGGARKALVSGIWGGGGKVKGKSSMAFFSSF